MLSVANDVSNRFLDLKALVIGDVMLDTYFNGSSTRLCPEAPVPVVDVAERLNMPGGAGNCAVNLAHLGADVFLLTAIGDDCEGDLLFSALDRMQLSKRFIQREPHRRTLFKARVACDAHMVVRFDQGSKEAISSAIQKALIRSLHDIYHEVDLVLVSDYGYGVVTSKVIECLAKLQAAYKKVLVVDAKNLRAYRDVGMTLCKPNYREALNLLGLPGLSGDESRATKVATIGQDLLEVTNSRLVALTLDREGALLFESGATPLRTFAQSAPTTHVAGAGDTYLSAFGLALAADAPLQVAAEIASTAAAIVVEKQHTATCSLAELKQRVAGEPWSVSDMHRLSPLINDYHRRHERIVLTNGCFDILHRGHIAYLEQAKRLGDVLIVGVNTDESIRRLKGPSRPINCLNDRLGVLAALHSVDHVVPFDEDTPHRLIENVRPHVFVKGGDYTLDALPEAELVTRLGGIVKILPFVADRSTTSVIERICTVYHDPLALAHASKD